jgi:ABC-2 type transport system ATP-binding protein
MIEDVLLAATDLTRSYGRIAALRGLDLELRRGEILGFLGLNGAGKSTAMQLLAGAMSADRGSVSVCGHDLQRAGRTARRQIGYLPQSPPLYDDMRVSEYLRLIARIHGVASKSADSAVEHASAMCGLADVGKRLIGHLSGGYRQRVGLAQAVLHDPSVLILDEPTSGLDPAQIRDVRALVTALAPDRAIMVSTHILSEVRVLATRVMILHEGRVVHDAPNDASGGLLRVRFMHEPASADVLALPGVEAAERGSDGYWLLQTGEDAAAGVAEHAVNAGWGIVELIQHYDALEHLFLRLTAGETVTACA